MNASTKTSVAGLSSLACAALLLHPHVAGAQQTNLLNRFTAGARLPFNVSIRFDNIGGFPARTDPGPATGSPMDRFYDDGYVGVDADQNAASLTWFWGYRDASQISGDNLRLNSSSAGFAAPAPAQSSDPDLGFEVAWLRELQRTDHYAAGFKLAFNFVNVTTSDGRQLSAPVRRLTDTYALGGITPPGNPGALDWQYQATRDQGLYNEAPVINDVPATREINPSAGTALTTGTRTLDANIFGWKLVPWIELPLARRLSLHGGAGLAVAVVDSQFRFDESTAIADVGNSSLSRNGSKTDTVAGVYAEAGFFLNLTDRVGLFLLGEFQHLESFKQTVSGRRATLDLGESWSLQTGITFSF